MPYHICIRFDTDATNDAICNELQKLYDNGANGMFVINGEGREKIGHFHRETEDDYDFIAPRVRCDNPRNYYELERAFAKAAVEQLVAEFEELTGATADGLVGIVLAALKADTVTVINASELVDGFRESGGLRALMATVAQGA